MHALRQMIRTEIHTIADELRALKRWSRTPPDGRPPPPPARFALHRLKRRATLLCMIMAHSRGRLHRAPAGGLDEQAAEIAAALDAMDRSKIQTPLFEVGVREAARAILVRRRPVMASDACVAPTEERRA